MNKRGFTLIETLIVLMILPVVMSALISIKTTADARLDAVKQQRAEYQALIEYVAEHGEMPVETEED